MKRLIFIFLALLGLFLILFKCTGNVLTKGYVIARDPSWAPLALLDKANDMLGFSDELLVSIAQEEKISIYLESINQTELFNGLDAHDYDGILTALTPSPQNFSKYEFSNSYYLLGPVLIIKESSTIQSTLQLENKLVGVMRDSSFVFDSANFPSIVIIPYDTPVAAIESLIKNNIDVVVMDALPAYYYAKKFYAGQIKVIDTPLTKKGLRLITRKDPASKELLEAFNRGLKLLKENGKYDLLLQRWDLVKE